MIKHTFITSLALAASLGATVASAQEPAAAPAAVATSTNSAQASLIKRGEYLARASDCIACHSAVGGKPFAGGLAIATPIGTVYSSNITSDKTHGIGTYTEQEFDQALRHGVRKDGATLYPAMPFPSYAKMAPADVTALYAYFQHGVPAETTPNRDASIPWPLSMRWPLSLWRMAFAPAVATGAPAGSGADAGAVARGRYLVEGMGHCGACHTPRGVGMQEKALTDDSGLFLSGGVVDGYLANNLRGDTKDGLGAWSEQDIVAFLKSGRNGHSAAFGGMADVVTNSTQHLTDDDLRAIASYLKTLKPAGSAAPALAYNEATHQALRNGKDQSAGAMDFLNNCAACHRSTGKGYDQTFPSLALSPTINAEDPASLIRIVLQGGKMPYTKSAPTQFAMPSFADRMSDADVANVVTFIRSSWGNKASAVSPAMVAKVRKDLPRKGVAMDSAPAPKR